MKINREKLFGMWSVFEELADQKSSVKFHYTVLKNKKLLEPEIEALKAANEPPPNHQEFESKRMKICGDYCEMDEDGKPKINGNNFIIPDDVKEEFEANLETLKEEYKDMFEAIEKAQKEFDELIKGEVDIDFVMIPMSIIPQDLVGQQVEALFDIIEEDK